MDGTETPQEMHAIWIDAVASSYPQEHAAWLDKIRAEALLDVAPENNFISRVWAAGERVERVSGGYAGNPRVLRPGTVVEIGKEVVTREVLVVRFDDGETRTINPDVMRHRKDVS